MDTLHEDPAHIWKYIDYSSVPLTAQSKPFVLLVKSCLRRPQDPLIWQATLADTVVQTALSLLRS
jgi:hypothetical protein